MVSWAWLVFVILSVSREIFGEVAADAAMKNVQGGYRRRNRVLGDRQRWIASGAESEGIISRQSRFLPIFTFVQFSNQECMGATGDNGTCLTAAQCGNKGGSSSGPCAGGYGICCVFLASCGSTIRENGTYFVQNGYPNPYDGVGSCQATLMKMSPDICQYRLDFDQFQIMGPETQNNMCNNDQFIVSGANAVQPLCGYNNGNHMYIDAGSGFSSPVTLSFITSGPSFRRTWKVRVSQISCNSAYKAEDGCLQYFTGVAGQIMSFNYEPNTGLHLSNQDYSICVRTERNFCGIQYTQCPDQVNNRSVSFTLTGNTLQSSVQAMVGSTGQSNFCQTDYLIIPMATNVGRQVTGSSANVDRICGGTLAADITFTSTPVRSIVRPFRLWFHTDSTELNTDQGNRGFCLNYVQQPCTNSLL